MTVNLSRPYDANPSRPRVEGVAFYAPGCDDFLFDGSRPPEIVCLPHKRALELEWSLANNRVQSPLASGKELPRYDNSFALKPPAKLPPGFYDLRVTIKLSDKESLQATTTFGWRVKEMAVYPIKPADFSGFWKTALAALDAIDPKPRWTLEQTLKGSEIDAYNLAKAALPENYDPQGQRADAVEIYRVKFTSYGNKTVEGWYSKPVGKGPFPTLLILPGAGNDARPAPVEHARHGYAALDIQVHGNPVNAAVYASLPKDDSTNPVERQHYGVYLNALEAARALKRLPGADPSRMAVLGGSQGGRLTVVVAALDPSFKAAIAAITHYANLPWLRWTERMNHEHQAGAGGFSGTAGGEFTNPSDAYFDVLNFAPSIRCPVLMNAGLIDPVSPPTGVFAVFQAIPGQKEMVPLPNTGHDWSPAFDRHAWKWLSGVLKTD